ncbi:Cytochrome b5 type B (outer mitochondrial membrane) [Dimargaris cristalligena]|uniref:Cytochrome b5 n=1 Tax=Dimargaris cristalligena TaxID=215637 RepID=A0A4P9ZLP4_9FUNG|nr:Cytochrome b5 type B (outer mitochondrial membrane) [Dimargaris cristalligena]RKP34055.1 cytochrome b5 [Dimargaris cristalligena]|eukprot:RKP34055.1 cytochrome b5 [Dimargaris cristalligena]
MSDVKIYTADQVAAHNTKNDLWCVVEGKVYDVTKFVDEHPGGEEVLLEHAGLDCTDAFEDVGHSEDARDLLAQYYMGDLSGATEPAGPPKPTVKKSEIAPSAKSEGSSILQIALPVAVFVAYLAYKLYA